MYSTVLYLAYLKILFGIFYAPPSFIYRGLLFQSGKQNASPNYKEVKYLCLNRSAQVASHFDFAWDVGDGCY